MVSFRNKVLGSWFMQAVIYIFRKNAHCEDILHMLADVSLQCTILQLLPALRIYHPGLSIRGGTMYFYPPNMVLGTS